MKSVMFIWLIGLCQLVTAEDWHDKWDRSGSTWVEKWTVTLDSIGDYEKSQQLEILGAAVRAKATADGWRPNQDQLAVANKAAGLLLAIPNHADFYQDEIIRARTERDAMVGKLEYSKKANDFQTTLHNSLGTLSQLPSPQSVRVLGDFLSDHSVNPFPIQDNMRELPLSRYALGAMAKLPFTRKPTSLGDSLISTDDLERDLAAWQGWYEQIKSGSRTFRFEGDPTEYDLNGPAPKEKLERIARAEKRDAERTGGQRKEMVMLPLTEAGKQPSLRTGILSAAGFCLIGMAVWYGWVRKKKAA